MAGAAATVPIATGASSIAGTVGTGCGIACASAFAASTGSTIFVSAAAVCGIAGASALAAAAADATTSARISGVTGVASEIAGGAPRNFGANTVSVRFACIGAPTI